MWNRQTWVGRGRDPDATEREVYDAAVLRLAGANPPSLSDLAAEEVLSEATDADDGDTLLRRVLAAEEEL